MANRTKEEILNTIPKEHNPEARSMLALVEVLIDIRDILAAAQSEE